MKYSVIKAIFIKQFKDTLKNKSILVQFVMFPVISIVLTSSISVSEIPGQYFVILFASMYVGMAPIIVLSNIIGEEKENGSLRMLLMSNVKPLEYILGISFLVMVICILGLFVMAVAGGYLGFELASFVIIGSIGMVVSILFGSIIGLVSKNQMMANSLSVPAMLICSFVPMLSMFNEHIKNFGQFIYTQQINQLFSMIPINEFPIKGMLIILGNLIILLVIYIRIFSKRKLLS